MKPIEREEQYCETAARLMRQEVLPLEYRDNNGGCATTLALL